MNQKSGKIQASLPTEMSRIWTDELLLANPVLRRKLEAIPERKEVSVERLLIEVLRFLVLIAHHNKVLTPPFLLDQAWHELILFTRVYDAFCREKFGRFIHHTPGGEKDENARQFRKTIQLYILTYGEPPAEIWGKGAHQEWMDAQCGSCQAN